MAKKILIIDDSALMRRVISDIIKTNMQYEVSGFATDGLDGFDKIVSHPKLYDAIILDINMPKMNGLELLEMLQKNRIQETVIVVSTVAKEGAKETIKALELVHLILSPSLRTLSKPRVWALSSAYSICSKSPRQVTPRLQSSAQCL